VAVFNTLCGIVWAYLVMVCLYTWSYHRLGDKNLYHFAQGAADFEKAWRGQWKSLGVIDTVASWLSMVLAVAAAYVVPFFWLLPFGTRPGASKACVKFVARVVMLGSGLVHWWGAAYCLVFLAYIRTGMESGKIADQYAGATTPLLLVFSGLILWHLPVLVHAVRREYRGAKDYPEPHDPWCDDCGYTLLGIDPAGQCPECGRLIADSLGAHSRPPTAWEVRPSIFNWRVILRQAWAIIRRPRSLFFSMPTLSGQPAAQRWLVLSMAMIFALGMLIVPALFKTLDADWNSVAWSGSLAMGLTWMLFGLMMVGIETAGIATFSRMRGHKVYLSTASKVTSYASVLMFLWVILGGVQLVVFAYLNAQPGGMRKMFHLNSIREEQIVLAISLAVAHIGGLIWYELVVYRGIRAIQFANK